jgi:chemotaxis protein methyltransferase CheR
MSLPAIDNPVGNQKRPELDGLSISGEAFEVIARILKNLKGFSLDIYKDKCIKRRIAIRIRATGCDTAEDYCEYLLRNDIELERLLKVLTIHVSQFFRNPQTFEKLRAETFPYLFALVRNEGREELKCWSVGCAGGEEPYSLAILLREAFPDVVAATRIHILATDVDAAVLNQARKGEYGPDRLADVSDTIRKRWFVETGGKFQLLPELTGMVDFQQRDLKDGDEFTESDLILCRNVLIYFERTQQEKIIKRFAEVLRKGGILVLGKSETLVGESRQRFRTICPVERIYQVI